MKALKVSVTKIVLLIIVISLVAIEIYKTLKGGELDQVFVDATIMVISFYYWQKGLKYEKTDSILEEQFTSEWTKEWTL